MDEYPVFAFPTTLAFYLNARHTHKQLLTVYNPYKFYVTFKVLCTAPNKFTVIDPEGVIAPQSCMDVVVRLTHPSLSHGNAIEKFRITMYDRNTQQELGQLDILTKLMEGDPSNTNHESLGDNFHPLPARVPSMRSAEEPPTRSPTVPYNYNIPHKREQQPINVIGVAVSICCIAGLLLPTQPEPVVHSQWPEWLRIGVSLKIVFAFVLGLVATNILRT